MPDEARRAAEAEGTALERFVGTSIAEKASTSRAAEPRREHAARADIPRSCILARAGRNNPPAPGDEIEPEARR